MWGCLLQALLGCLLFGETLSMQWWLGTSLILTGLILIHYNSTPLTNDQGHDKREWMGLKRQFVQVEWQSHTALQWFVKSRGLSIKMRIMFQGKKLEYWIRWTSIWWLLVHCSQTGSQSFSCCIMKKTS